MTAEAKKKPQDTNVVAMKKKQDKPKVKMEETVAVDSVDDGLLPISTRPSLGVFKSPESGFTPPKDAVKLSKKEIAELQTPFVLVDGYLITPTPGSVQSIDPKYPGMFRINTDYGSPVQVLEKGRGKIDLIHYQVTINKEQISLYLDSNSSFVHSGFQAPWIPRSGQLSTRSTLVLLNSSSEDDHIRGTVVLENITSKGNTLKNSKIGVGDNRPGHNYALANAKLENECHEAYYGLVGIEQTAEDDQKKSVVRLSIEDSQFGNCVIRNSKITRGTYINVTFDNVTIEVSLTSRHTHATFKGVHSFNAKFAGKYIRAITGDINHTVIESEGNINLDNFRLLGRDGDIYGKGVYIPNKFSYCVIETPGRDYKLLRVNRTELAFSGPHRYGNDTPIIPLDSSYTEVQAILEKALSIGSYDGLYPPINQESKANDPITRSIVKFVIDSVWSRMKIIRLVDSASSIDQVINPVKEDRYDHVLRDGGSEYF